jgi:hypothetical protein
MATDIENEIKIREQKILEHDRIAQENSRAAELLKAEVRGMKIAMGSANFSDAATKPSSTGKRKSKGRQPGAITKRWQNVLSGLYSAYDKFRTEDAVNMVRILDGRDMRPSEVSRIFTGYVSHGHLTKDEIDGEDIYAVTEKAAKKYGFIKPDKSESQDSNANEALVADAASASEVGGWGAPTPTPSESSTQAWPSS